MSATDFLGHLDAASRADLLACGRRRHVKKGEFVFRVGQQGDSVFVLLSGRAKTYKLAPDGREVILWFSFPGDIFGLVAHPHAKGRMVSVEACEASAVVEVPDTLFEAFLRRHPEASQLRFQAVAFRLGMLANRLVHLTADNAAARIAKLLVDLAVRYGDHSSRSDMSLSITHQEIADVTGVQRQTVTRVLGEFTACGALAVRYRRISITDLEFLATYAARRAHASDGSRAGVDG
jgi:CRP/FNR family cyclic AMP-dependent transcriptional regulator